MIIVHAQDPQVICTRCIDLYLKLMVLVNTLLLFRFHALIFRIGAVAVVAVGVDGDW